MGYLAKLTPDGELIWQRRYFYITDVLVGQAFLSSTPTSDHGYAACGRLNQGSASRLWVIKTDSMGCIVPGCDSLDNSINNIDVNQQQQWFTFGPNPVSSPSEILNVYLGNQPQNIPIKSRNLTFKLTNLQGQIVKEFEVEGFGVTYMIPLSDTAAGSYVLSLDDGNRVLQSSTVVVM